jgi:dipeptidyl aminopeptidase/acylaminoacyl peptidase
VIATASGHLLWVRGGTLIAQSLDVTRTALVGQPTPIAHDVAIRSQMPAHFSAADDVVVFLTRREAMASVHMAVFDRSGAIVSSVGDVAEYSAPRVAPDGGRVAVAQRDPETGTRDIWVHDLNGRPPLRLTFNVHDDTAPVWSADGRAISFTSDRRGERDLYRKDVDGRQPEVLLFASDESKSLNAVSRDGTVLVYDTGARGSVDGEGRFNASDLKAVSVESTPRIYPIATTPAHEDMGDISPDGGLIAYHASENADRVEIFVETFPVKAGRWQVTTNGGSNPIWRADGRELFFLTPDRQVASVDVERSAGAVRFGPIRVLFPVPAQHADVRPFAPFPDGRRFLVLTDVPRPVPQKLSVLVNWRSLLPDQ